MGTAKSVPKGVFIDYAVGLGGGQVSLLTLMKELSRRGWQCIVVTPAGSALHELACQNAIQAVRLTDVSPLFAESVSGDLRARPWRLLSLGFSIVFQALKVTAVLKRERPDFVHCNSLKAALVAGVASRLLRIPVIWHDRTQNMNAMYRLARSLATHVVAVSSWVKLKHQNSRKVSVVYNGVDLNSFETADGKPFRQSLNALPGDVVVGAVSRLTPWKGLETLIRAAAILGKTVPYVKTVIVGDEQIETGTGEKQRLQTLAVSLGIEDRVVFAGFRRDVATCIAALDVVVVPSIEPEPFGRVIIEGMASGKCVVASEIGGIPELVRNGENGFLVKPGDCEGLAAVIADLALRPNLRSAISQNARKTAKLFSSDVHASRIISLLQSELHVGLTSEGQEVTA